METVKLSGGLALAGLLNNYFAGSAPTASNDATQGYAPGSVWVDTLALPAKIYSCVNSSAGAAVWVQLSDGSSAVTQSMANQPNGYMALNASGQAVGTIVSWTNTAQTAKSTTFSAGELATATGNVSNGGYYPGFGATVPLVGDGATVGGIPFLAEGAQYFTFAAANGAKLTVGASDTLSGSDLTEPYVASVLDGIYLAATKAVVLSVNGVGFSYNTTTSAPTSASAFQGVRIDNGTTTPGNIYFGTLGTNSEFKFYTNGNLAAYFNNYSFFCE